MFFRKRTYRKLGNHSLTKPTYEVGLCKEEISRKALEGRSGRFLEIGAGDRELRYLLGVRENLDIDEAFYQQNRKWFDERFTYTGVDIEHDICNPEFSAFPGSSFDVVYSNNVFEHLRKPWVAAKNILHLLKAEGICITIVPFSQRYHAVPGDYFRYTHTGIVALFEDAGPIKVLISGYDIKGRRNDWQGGGLHDDIVPIDELGAWRETWFTVCVIEKPSG